MLPNVQRDENQADITKMLNIGGDPAEWDFGYVPPPPPDTAPASSFSKPAPVGRGAMRMKQSDFRNTTVGGRKKCSPSGLRGPQPAIRCSPTEREEMQSAGLCGPQPRRAEARNSLFVRLRPPHAATRKHFINTHASASPAAEAILGKGGHSACAKSDASHF